MTKIIDEATTFTEEQMRLIRPKPTCAERITRILLSEKTRLSTTPIKVEDTVEDKIKEILFYSWYSSVPESRIALERKLNELVEIARKSK